MIYTLKNQSIFRPASCPPTPLPNSPAVTGSPRPLSRVPFTLRRSSLTPTASPTPTPAPLIHDGSYLEALGLRLNEAVSKALSHPSGPSLPGELLGRRRPIPAGRGRALCLLIASELQAARNDPHLYRAVLRALQKPLSVLLSDLSALLLPLLSSPAFLQPSAHTPFVPAPNATQLHALAFADFTGEVLSSFDDLALGLDIDNRGDGLKPIRAGLVSILCRVITPLIAGIKHHLIPLIDALEAPAKATCCDMKGSVHPSIVVLQSSVPICGRALARYTSAYPSHPLLASFLISIVWRALVALSHRATVVRSSLENGRQYSPAPGTQTVTSTGLFNLKRGPSRPTSPVCVPTAAADGRALCKLFSHLPRPHNQVAREAVDEAFVHLEALVSLLETADDPLFGINKTVREITDEINGLTQDLPTLIALPVLLRMQYFEGVLGSQARVATLLNVSEDAYHRDYLTGFGRAEQYGPIVAQRVLDEIYTQPFTDASERLVDWLENSLGQTDC